MAIYHCSIKPISRGDGRSIVAAAAYRHACKLEDYRTGEVHDYSRKEGLEHSAIYLPSGVKTAWAQNRGQLWNAAEAAEKRKDARVGREIVIALPDELSAEQRRELTGDLARHIAERYGLAVDVAIHQPSRQGDQRNHHAHILMSSRRITQEGFAEKARELDDHKRGSVEVEHIRAKWAQLANCALELAGCHERIDHKSFQRQGIKRMPSIHLGKAVTAMERRDIQTRLGNQNRAAKLTNREVAEIEQQLETIKKQQADIPPEPLKGAELVPVIERLRHELVATSTAIQAAEERQRRTESALADVYKAIEQHNIECKNTGFFKRILKTTGLNARAEKLDEEASAAVLAVDAAEEEKEKAKRVYNSKQAEFEKVLAEYEKSPHGQFIARRQAERAELEKEYGEAIKKMVLPEFPRLAIERVAYGEYLDKMQAASPEQRAEMAKELKHAERRYEVQELFYAVAERYSQDTSISGRKRFRDAMLKNWDAATPEERKQMELAAEDHISRAPEKQRSRGMKL